MPRACLLPQRHSPSKPEISAFGLLSRREICGLQGENQQAEAWSRRSNCERTQIRRQLSMPIWFGPFSSAPRCSLLWSRQPTRSDYKVEITRSLIPSFGPIELLPNKQYLTAAHQVTMLLFWLCDTTALSCCLGPMLHHPSRRWPPSFAESAAECRQQPAVRGHFAEERPCLLL